MIALPFLTAVSGYLAHRTVSRSIPFGQSPGSEVSALANIKQWFKLQNKERRLLWLQFAWRYLKGLYYFHPRQRFVHYLEGRAGTLLGIWKPILSMPCVINRRFYVFSMHVNGSTQVIKLARGNTAFSCDLINALKDPTAFARYETTLKNLTRDRWLRNHTVTASRIRTTGGYTSEFVEGINLAQLTEQTLSGACLAQHVQDGLLQGIQQLLEDLTGYSQEHGHLIGDWALQNLIYSPDRQAVINVDAEGFFTYSDGQGEASLPFIETNLLNLTELIRLSNRSSVADARVADVFRVMDEVRRGDKQYSGAAFVAGYHSLEICGRTFRGQRECSERLAAVPFDFRGKVVLDLGCNAGGMLHALAKTIRKGYGFDVNPDCVNTAQLLRSANQSSNLEFFTFDLDRQDFSLLQCFLLEDDIDICFLLSMCAWLDRWELVVRDASRLAEAMLFESNGTAEQQKEQVAVLRECYRDVVLVSASSSDDFSLGRRKLYLATRRNPQLRTSSNGRHEDRGRFSRA